MDLVAGSLGFLPSRCAVAGDRRTSSWLLAVFTKENSTILARRLKLSS